LMHAKSKKRRLVLLEWLAKKCGLIALDNVGTAGTVSSDSNLGCQVFKTRLEPPVPTLG
jgi:predicted O-methyltransferase YrrM